MQYDNQVISVVVREPEIRCDPSAAVMLSEEMMLAFPRTPSTVLQDPTAHFLREAGSMLLFSVKGCPVFKHMVKLQPLEA